MGGAKPVPEERPLLGYVYAIGATDGPIKIGVATDVASRCAMLQTGNHLGISILHKVLVSRSDAFMVERYAHELLSADRVRGEWFDVDPDEAIAAVNAALKTYQDGSLFDAPVPRDWMYWQRRLKASGLSQSELAKLVGKRENAISEGLRGKGKGGVPTYLKAVIRLWEVADKDRRERILADPDDDD